MEVESSGNAIAKDEDAKADFDDNVVVPVKSVSKGITRTIY